MFAALAAGQSPLALFITCSDSRIDPNLLTQTEPGELFVLRNAGNIVPPYGANGGGEAATIEYALRVLKVPQIVICGHSHCGAMHALLNAADFADLPATQAWLDFASETRRAVSEKNPQALTTEERLTAAVEENVLVQLDHLRSHPAVAAALAAGKLQISGWVYRFETGEVSVYDADSKKYVAID
jgi:carbonic anhydrase